MFFKKWEPIGALSPLFRYGENSGGTPYMRSHIFVHRATTKYFSNSFVFKNKIEKEGLPRDITPALGAGGPEFKSRRPDQNISRVIFSSLKAPFTSNPIFGILADRRSGFASRFFPRVRRITNLQKHGDPGVLDRRIKRREVKRTILQVWENSGDPAHFSSH